MTLHICTRSVLDATLALLFAATPVAAFNPPVDTAGPLTVRIEGPDVLHEMETAVPVRVVFENKSDRPIDGTVELRGIDHWRTEPAEAAFFSVPPKGNAMREFRVFAGQGSYNAWYPIHAFANFTVDGKPLAAHPILLLTTQFPNPLQAAPNVEWKPFAVAANRELALWRLPAFRAVVQVFGQPPKTLPIGWRGSEPATGATAVYESAQRLGDDTHESLVMHPPWIDGKVGAIFVEFPLRLPKAEPLQLRFANGMGSDGKGDGAIFRVRVLPFDAPEGKQGEVVFERYCDAATWHGDEVDLGQFAGQDIRLQLESHPGPKNDTNCDCSVWAEPTLVAGKTPEPTPFPLQDNAKARTLGAIKRDGKCYDVRLWLGQRGLLDATVEFQQGESRLCFHGFEVLVDDNRLDDPRSPATLVDVKDETGERGLRVRHHFQGVSGPFDLVGELWVDRGSLQTSFRLENAPLPQPWHVVRLEDVAAGQWNAAAGMIYAGHGNVIRQPQAKVLYGNGMQLSTSFVGFDFVGVFSMVQAVNVPPNWLCIDPPRMHYSLHSPHSQTLTFIPSDNVWTAVQTWHDINGLQPAGGVKKLAGRFAFDLWGGRYADHELQLRLAFRYGLTNSVVVFHDWQRWGYDYRLPEIYPPNPNIGTFDEFCKLAATCKEAGVLFALHDNYIDFYPDADGFSYDKVIAFDSPNEPTKGWWNLGRKAQAYRYRADAVEPFLTRNLRLIRDGIAPTGYFVDVWAAASPHDYWTAKGEFIDRVKTQQIWRERFTQIRDFLGGAPTISESGHDLLIGGLDGAQADNFRAETWGWECADAERIPWHDAAHHDRFILLGAGITDRYEAGLDSANHGPYSDDYMTTEVLTGHPALASKAFGRNVVRKYWLTNDLMQALALRRIEGVDFVDGDIHRQHVRWSGGGEVWVNRGPSDWNVAGQTLPQYGFLARVPVEQGVVQASISRRGGAIVETARSADQWYVNGRQAEVDFGPVTTKGGIRLTREGKTLLVTPLPVPNEPSTVVQLRPALLNWQLPEFTVVEALAEDGTILNREPVHRESNQIVLECNAGAFAYRLLGE